MMSRRPGALIGERGGPVEVPVHLLEEADVSWFAMRMDSLRNWIEDFAAADRTPALESNWGRATGSDSILIGSAATPVRADRTD